MRFAVPRNIDYMRLRKPAVIVSSTLVLLAIAMIAIRGLNFGIDFTGGTLIEVGYSEPVRLEVVRDALAQGGIDRTIVQHFGTSQDVLIRIPPAGEASSAELSDRVLRLLKSDAPSEVEMRRVEFVGPQVGEELREDGGLAVLFATIGILIYVAFRFELRFALGAVIAIVHDVVITVGFFAATGIEFDLTVLAAALAVLGYSLNDTIVVFDRVRENFRKRRKLSPVEVVNVSINETMARTIVTGLTTLLVLIALLLFGGEIMYGFAVALIIGVVVGTYSSIYIASGLLLMLGVSKADLTVPKREGDGGLGDQP
jgi:preprotein translocase subunit SecF